MTSLSCFFPILFDVLWTASFSLIKSIKHKFILSLAHDLLRFFILPVVLRIGAEKDDEEDEDEERRRKEVLMTGRIHPF